MIKFIKKIIVFAILLGIVVFSVPIVGSIMIKCRAFNNGNAESNLLVLSDEKEFDLLLLGNSHARNFSRNNQHENLEKALNGKVLNMGQGRGVCGLNDQLLYFKYLLNKGYNFEKLIYTVAPPHLYGNHLDSVTTTFFQEPLSIPFLFEYIFHPAPNKKSRLFHYVKTKWKPSWIFLKPDTTPNNTKELKNIDPLVVQSGFDTAYPNGLLESNFLKSAAHLEAIIELALENDIKVILLETPILFEKWPGQKRLREYCLGLKQKGLVEYFDLKHVIADPKYFYDHHHLNTAGIEKILPLLEAKLKLK